MKLILAMLALAAGGATLGDTATAQVLAPSTSEGPYNPYQTYTLQFRAAMLQLRQEALALRAADGGTLTPAHDQLIQRKLDAVHARYARELRRSDRFSVDPMGSPIAE